MNTYLVIITTILVVTQIIRITQNTINLFHQEHELKKHIGWIKDNEVTREDFEMQRKAYRLIVDKLEKDEVSE